MLLGFRNKNIFIFLLYCIASSYAYANQDCSTAYQWTSYGSFMSHDVVRYKGVAYKAKWWSSNERPDQFSGDFNVWQKLGTCIAYSKVTCDFNGDGKIDSAQGFPNHDMVGARISSTNPQVPSYREYEKFVDTGEVGITYDATSSTQPIDTIWNQNIMGMFGYARPKALFGDRLSTGDFNNDNFCDLAIGAPGFSYDMAASAHGKGLVNILYGSPSGLTTIVLGENGRPINPFDAQRFDQDSPDVPETAEAGDLFGGALSSGDLNGDGYDDLVVGAYGEGVVLVPQLGEVKQAGFFHILYGSKNGIQTKAPKTTGYFQHISGVPIFEVEKNDIYGGALATADFDNDGYSDLAVAAPGEDQNRGKISLFRGSSVGIDTSSRRDFSLSNFRSTPVIPHTYFGRILRTADFNSDGFVDLEVDYFDQTTSNIFATLRIKGSASGLVIP